MTHRHSRVRRLVRDAIARFELDLTDLTVLTEAATDYYALTPVIAALAGAKQVLALGRDSRYGTLAEVERSIRSVAAELGASAPIEILNDRSDSVIAGADIVTNLGFVRPIDEPLLSKLGPQAVVSLMWETWEHRPEELDRDACKRLGIAILGTNENDERLRTLDYTGLIAAKLLLQLDVELLQSRIALIGSGDFARSVIDKLGGLGAQVDWIDERDVEGKAATEVLESADALVIAMASGRETLIGESGALSAERLAQLNPGLAVAHIAGGADRDALAKRGLRCMPERFAPPPHMSAATDFLGPKPVIDLHTAGLKVGEELARARRAGMDAEQAQTHVIEHSSLAMAFDLPPPTPHPADALRARIPRLQSMICLTIDIDWAPDFIIDFVRETLIDHDVRATFFVTHESPALQRLKDRPDLFELGIHPNFLPGSTHGQSIGGVLEHCMELAPSATSMRTHCLHQSTPILQKVITDTAIDTEVSLLMPGIRPHMPFEHRYGDGSLLRIPYGWEDTFSMESRDMGRPPIDPASAGLQVLAFHPIHIYLNSASMDDYARLKARVSNLAKANIAEVDEVVRRGFGMRSRFLQVVRQLQARGRSTMIRDVRPQLLPGPPA